jgi:hypothetical protein
MTLSEQRRRQILDYGPEAPHFDAGLPGNASAPRNNSVQDDTQMKEAKSANEDTWVTGFVGRLAALIRDVGGK